LFIADLHVHSRYSRATSKSLTVKKLGAWARIKGINLIATGDFTHPGWIKEIEETLVQRENGLLYLKDPDNLNKEIEIQIDFPIDPDVCFILCTEISSIYKKAGKLRKVHNLVFMPSIEKAKEFNKKLEKIGNLTSDGRPILGLDSEHLLEMVLDTHPMAFLVPAHIWTPWFSLFGSRSGFDSIEECFGSLSSEIFALETGLSSDPPMNWMWSKLDRFYLISNSDAHSGEKLGREANLFKGEISYFSIYNALKNKTGDFIGTIEFFPEEGKYHLDGHRKCGVVLDPVEAIKLNNICPVCKRPLTIGVMHRILSLADRKQPQKPAHAPGFHSLIPLTEILAEIMNKGAKTKIVYNVYSSLIKKFKSELHILMQVDPEELKTVSPLLAEGIKRMRQGKVYKKPGFDGQYGEIFLFKESEKKTKAKINIKNSKSFLIEKAHLKTTEKKDQEYNCKQLKAIKTQKTPVLVMAGPGTGKTRTLLGRAIYLIKELQLPPSKILILTFTTAAAAELQNRMKDYPDITPPVISTLHSLGYEILKKQTGSAPLILNDIEAKKLFLKGQREESLWTQYLYEREKLLPITSKELHEEYKEKKQRDGVFDYTDLLELLITYLKDNPQQDFISFKHVLVDEIQDLSPIQLEVLKLLSGEKGKGLFGIGDPDQAIYSFRGGVYDIISNLKEIYPHLEILSLEKNYRSAKKIVSFSSPLIQFGTPTIPSTREKGKVYLYEAATSDMEAMWIARQIKKLIGSTSHMEADQGMEGRLSPSEIAVLVRFKSLIEPIKKALDKFGIPCSTPQEINFFEDPQVERFLDIVFKHIVKNETTLLENVDTTNINALETKLIELKIFDPIFFNTESYLKLKMEFKRSKDWTELLNWIALQKEYESISQRAQKVVITTIHASKGLEFEAVFLPCLEDNILPFNKEIFINNNLKIFKNNTSSENNILSSNKEIANNNSETFKNNINEEKRLLFVGVTRARSMLFLSYSKKRKLYGKNFFFSPSPFLSLLPLKEAIKIKATLKKKKKVQDLRLGK